MLENDATEIPTRISTGFPLERKEKEAKNSMLLRSQSFRTRELNSQTSNLDTNYFWIDKTLFLVYFICEAKYNVFCC